VKTHRHGWLGPVLVAATLLAGCATGPAAAPGHETPLPFQLDRMQEQTRDGVTVHLVIPTEEEWRRSWCRLRGTRHPADLAAHHERPRCRPLFLPIAIDADYYSADEAALVAGAKLSQEQGAALTDALRAKGPAVFHAAARPARASFTRRTCVAGASWTFA